MTSRTPLGAQQRQPQQRTLSSSSLGSQRPTPQPRSMLHPSSPIRRDAESSEVMQQGANTPKRGGSRLRLELTTEQAVGAAVAVESPQSLASARALSTLDGHDMAHSPALSRASQQETDNPPLPMPKRKQHTAQTSHTRQPPQPPPPSIKKDGRPKPYAIPTPPDAPRLATPSNKNTHIAGGDFFGKGLYSGRADFFPWTGKHLEDEWTHQSIAKGVFERYSATESSSGKNSIYTAIKGQKTSLNALSTIFMGVLNQRRQRDQVTAPSTFKPPPRVTLTDTKREVWLKDLANPATSLRRLSRTIPHGIRGRALLDQCLNKKVPTERAVWLAKCVGANEIRAFKRKGVNGALVIGNEVKWIRDWTIFVEQFLECTMLAASDDDWKAKTLYAVRLATGLYSEHLVDREHYLEWMIKGLESSGHGKLPMWMLICGIHWDDFLRARKSGQRLVAAFLHHSHTIETDPDKDVMAQLAHQISSTLLELMSTAPESFVQPTLWPTHRDSLKSYLPVNDEHLQRVWGSINSRNTRLMICGSSYPPAGRQRLIKLLDSTLHNVSAPDFAAKCWATSDDKAQVFKTLMEWATSVHRPHLSKNYVATTLIKTFKTWLPKADFDMTTPLLDILDRVESEDQHRKQGIYHLVAELIKDRSFSVSQYFQWLIARGGVRSDADLDAQTSPCGTRLLIELPLACVSDKLRRERVNLLRKAKNHTVPGEEEDISIGVRCVRLILGLPVGGDASRKLMTLKRLTNKIRASSRTLKCAVSAHLRDVMVEMSMSSHPAAVSTFTTVRAILEATEDYAVLSDVVKSCLKSTDAELLAACANTVNANMTIFLALASANECFTVLMERLRAHGQQGVVPRPLLAAVCHLAQRLPGRTELASQLRQDLLQSDRSNAIDACSPVSDNMMATQATSGEVDLSDEIDRLLASGNRIDQPTMNRLFRTIVPRLEGGWHKQDDTRRTFASLLTKMRVFDPQHFDRLMSDWISHVRTLPSRGPLSELLPLLVVLGCVPLTALLQTADASPPMTAGVSSQGEGPGAATYLQELLQLLLLALPRSTVLSAEEAYQFKIHQASAQSEHGKALFLLIRNAMAEYAACVGYAKVALPLADKNMETQMLNALSLLVVADSPGVSEALCIKNIPGEAVPLVSDLTTKLLLPDRAHGNTQISFDQILGLASELTLPFCQLKLEFDLSKGESQPVASEDPAPSRFDLFANAMDRAIEANNITWTSMLPCLSHDISQHLKSLAHTRFLRLLPSLKTSETSTNDQVHLAENLLGVIEAITTGQTGHKSGQLTNNMVEKLCDLCDIIASKDPQTESLRRDTLAHWLPAMLRLITLQGIAAAEPVVTPPPTTGPLRVPIVNHEARARTVVALGSLLLALDNARPLAAALSQHVFDVALLLVDALPDDLRHQCARHLLLLPGCAASSTLSSDPRLYYVLSTPRPTASDNLVLSHREKPTTPQSTGAIHRGAMGAMYGIGPPVPERLTPFVMRRWEMLSESTPLVGENDTSLNLCLFESIKIQ
ncbi:Mediator of RNA polymerase II transcription subunit-like protein [Emericellopsis cladophorae]|uniref:Mediator of RNA polymerase II transcription subunit 12 n=1 Tax=Emericellopsis cladophorae TaxID=2686198 RepID=A0A9Q0BC66_9HYPO|nr:Mediator of RNA polymerase II transcription subunit-like protein [Emericellopsis cladophorae]KAI6780022.1 Mediator of RNA polymerase II transcription subunit-like protein [Emericellopsis cladophorae]